MKLTDLDPDYQTFVTHYLETHIKHPAEFNTTVSPNDDMFYKAILPGYEYDVNVSYFKYIESGKRSLDAFLYRGDQSQT